MPPDTSAPVAIRQATAADAALVATLVATTFQDTFAAENDPADMAAHAHGAFGESIQGAELVDPRMTVLLAERNGAAAGYVMLREGPPPACLPWRDALEIARLYAVRDAIGTGVGAALMAASLATAAARGRRAVWLGVWERNARAIAFYERWGFRDRGSQIFQLGRDRQTDRVMARSVVVA
jgi:ribosomal protein S18 acetylase RimI-like enzyme